MGKTKIEWTDMSWPVVTGCSPVSTGCRNCYAARMAATRLKHHPRYKGLAAMATPGTFQWTGEVRLNYDVLKQPLHWRKPRMVFVASMGDLFHEDVPFEFITEVFDVMCDARSQHHVFQVLTKRPERFNQWLNWVGEFWPGDSPFSIDWEVLGHAANVHLGVSVENQAAADERLPILREIPNAMPWVSYEPALGSINWGPHLDFLRWCVCGGETGPGARPMHPQWARDIRDQCQAAGGIPYFHKQNGEYIPASGWNQWGTSLDGGFVDPSRVRAVQGVSGDIYSIIHMVRVGRDRAGRLLDGVLWEEYPNG